MLRTHRITLIACVLASGCIYPDFHVKRTDTDGTSGNAGKNTTEPGRSNGGSTTIGQSGAAAKGGATSHAAGSGAEVTSTGSTPSSGTIGSANGGTSGTETTEIVTNGGAAVGGTTSFSTSTGAGSTGGDSAQGASSGVGGIARGGSTGTAIAGGSASTSGGSAVGGTAKGGAATGGVATGGVATGGVATGGVATGGVATGGVATGGVATGGFTAVQCTNTPFEAKDAAHGNLCVAKSKLVGTGGVAFEIDMTEVTRGQYRDWVNTAPAKPTDSFCADNVSYAPDPYCMDPGDHVYHGTDQDHHPAICVTFCDAVAYCLGVGKRLCGSMTKGTLMHFGPYDYEYKDPKIGQYYAACSSGGANPYYTYGSSYQGQLCNDAEYWPNESSQTTVKVGSVSTCQSSTSNYTGIYDLMGNVMEWQDSCIGVGNVPTDTCLVMGGSYVASDIGQQCTYLNTAQRWNTYSWLGFRCCK